MTDTRQAAFEAFLVEDVILTLANLRASLAWLGETAAADQGGADDASRRRAGLDRIDRQIGMLEDRARAVCDGLRQGCDEAGAAAVAPAGQDDVAVWLQDCAEDRAGEQASPGAVPGTGTLTIAEAIRDALGEDASGADGGSDWPGTIRQAAAPAAGPEDRAAPIFRSRRAG